MPDGWLTGKLIFFRNENAGVPHPCEVSSRMGSVAAIFALKELCSYADDIKAEQLPQSQDAKQAEVQTLGMQDETRYQVFVSSTFTDLKEEREKVLQAILQLRAFPAGMELFPAADEDQFEFIKREIDSSDYYVVIVAGRYGSVASDGLSYTEKEYDYARATGKPVIAFVVKDIGKLIGDKLEKSDELCEKLRMFSEKAKSGKLVNFFSNPDELKAAALVSLPSQFNLKPMRG